MDERVKACLQGFEKMAAKIPLVLDGELRQPKVEIFLCCLSQTDWRNSSFPQIYKLDISVSPAIYCRNVRFCDSLVGY